MNNKKNNLKVNIIVWCILLMVIIILWEFWYDNSESVRYLISGPSSIFDYFVQNKSGLAVDFAVTLTESIVGLLLAISACLIITLIFCFIPFLIQFIYPGLVVTQVIPLVALAPLVILIFGPSISGKIAMSVIMCFFPVLVNTITGIKSIPQHIIDLMYMYSASRWKMIRYVYFPLSTQHIMAGIKISATLSVIGAIIAEFNGADSGLGRNIFIAAKRLEPELMMSSLFLSGIMGGLLYFSVVLIEKKIGHWYLHKSDKLDNKT